ncbi:hypothetical protein [Neorhodopirellula lusitana]|nr:hypothetical protein [Neorhodopirellula lusitana]
MSRSRPRPVSLLSYVSLCWLLTHPALAYAQTHVLPYSPNASGAYGTPMVDGTAVVYGATGVYETPVVYDVVPDSGNVDVTNWLVELDRIEEQLDADQLPDLPSAERSLSDSIAATEAYFQRSSNPDNYAAWMRYLDLDPLKTAIADEESIATRGRAAVALRSQMRGVERGLELIAMRQLRETLDQYITALRYSNPKRGLQLIERQLDGLRDLLAPEPNDDGVSSKDGEEGGDQSPAASPVHSWRDWDVEELATVEMLLEGLATVGQAKSLATDIRSRFSQPNLYVWVDGSVVTQAVTRPVNNPNDVNDCILGTRLRGQAQVTGNVTGQLLPQEGYVRLLIRMDGQFTTSTRGFRKPITLDSTGVGPVYAARQLAITEKGIVLGQTIATADLSTQIRRINHPLKIVRKIAMRKALEAKPEAERISRGRLQQRVLEGFDEETAQAATREFPDFDAVMRPWLLRLDFPPLTRTIGSTEQAVFVRAKMQRSLGFSTSTTPPSLSGLFSSTPGGVTPGGYAATVQVHQSLIDTTLGKLLAGETYTRQRIERIAEVLGAKLDERPSDEDPFEIDFANFRPVYVEADDQTLKLGIRGTRFAQGDRELKRPIEVSATYRLVIGPGNEMWMVRDPEVKLSFSGSRRLTISQTAIKTNIEESFDRLFPQELLHRKLQIPTTIAMPALAGKQVKIKAIDLTDGWISIAVR